MADAGSVKRASGKTGPISWRLSHAISGDSWLGRRVRRAPQGQAPI